MAIAPGSFLGPYEVIAPIGAGGMGEVYRGKDSRLGREVAIKVLPPEFSSDPDRLRRFEQEARATGLMNHPNILSVYDIGSNEGSPYVVSELLSGETLRQRIGGTAIPQRKAIEIALQIAHGLAAAHEKGIVHRDLKPENIFITRDGRVKILDFGLAKLTIPEAVGGGSRLDTLEPGTEPGIVLGTIGYMSPEQVRGRDVDQRSDIFSLGAILYEMLTGQRAFHRDSTADTMSAILKEDPPDLSGFNKNIPPALDRIIRHCLEKNAEERFQSARDLAFDLEMITGVSGTMASGQAVSMETTRKRKKYVTSLLILFAGAVFGFLAHTLLQLQSTEREDASFQRLTFRRGYVSAARFASDKQTILYSANFGDEPNTIYSTRPQSPVSRSLGLANADLLSVSANGEMAVLLNPRFLVGWTRTGTLARVPIDGGAPRQILENVQDADWSPNSQDLAVVRASQGIFRLEFPIGKVLYQSNGWMSHIRIAPSGKLIAFLEHPSFGDDRGHVSVVDLQGKKTVLTEEWASASGLAWSSDGNEIWFTASKEGSNQQPVSAVSLSGEFRIVAGMAGNLVLHDVSKEGQVLLTQDNRRREMMAYTAGDDRERDISWFDWSFPRDLSADGKLVLFEEQGAGGGHNYSVYLRGLDGSPAIRLGDGYAVALSPDGKQALAVVPHKENQPMVLPTGAGQARRLDLKDVKMQIVATWLSDGNRLVFIGRQNDRPPRGWLLDIKSGKVKPVTPEDIGPGFLLTLDEKALLTKKDQSYVLYDLNNGDSRPMPAIPSEVTPLQWSVDGNSVYVMQPSVLPIRIHLLNLQTGQMKLWKEITPSDVAGIQVMGSFLLTRDGQAYVYTYRRVISDLYLAKGLQ